MKKYFIPTIVSLIFLSTMCNIAGAQVAVPTIDLEMEKNLLQEIPFLGTKMIALKQGEKVTIHPYPNSKVTLEAWGEIIVSLDGISFKMFEPKEKVLKKGVKEIVISTLPPKSDTVVCSGEECSLTMVKISVVCTKDCPFKN